MTLGEEGNYITKIEELSGNVTYIGKAARGSLDAAAVWQIKKIIIVGAVITVSFADKVDMFTKVWDDRASYTYL